MSRHDHHGTMAVFAQQDEWVRALKHLHAAGFTCVDAYSPQPVEGLPPYRASSPLPIIMFAAGLCGGLGMLALQYYSAVIAYPVHIGGRPLASWPAFVPAALEVSLLCAAVAGVIALLAGSGLPCLYHPVFHVDAFARISQDRYALVLRSDDAHYTPDTLAVHLYGFATEAIARVPR
ncbi:quinol:cytochrome c oxidoreductase membrane protein [Dyella jiangningensis]|uniref:DUF3341 domain-containing protein n=1 Tax=Dyella sp. AtDHG13 TaxID=1938897 RepID=UPI00088ECD5B|nr:DUF3341 domain-containing protein [Dyella sp. AtDHG13]PXV55850.1 quinol:cytochrome c oxidoreductase membrane protein [Dyella sp. AtDHG13]SDK53975.1 quinol:cytochrome c oxidoreductase membrane protein [Dyella jiangningensis]